MCNFYFFFSSRRRHTRSKRDWSSDVCSSDLVRLLGNPLEQVIIRPGCGTLGHDQQAEQGRQKPFPGCGHKRSEERRVGKSVDLGGRRMMKKESRRQMDGTSRGTT